MREYLLTALVAAAATYLLVPLVRVFAIRIGAMPEVRDRDVHTTPTPRLGGLAMYGGLVAGLLVAANLPYVGGDGGLAAKELAGGKVVTALILAGGLITLTGFLDDWWGMDALIKLAGQIGAAGVLAAFDVTLPWIPLPSDMGGVQSLDSMLRALITILIVVVMINAVNFVDGLDGLAAGIVGIAAMATWTYAIFLSTDFGNTSINATATIAAVLIGMCLGFLPHNFHPAKIFMGDTGAMLIGLVLASTMITITPLDSNSINTFPVILPLLLPVAILVLPLLDLIMAVIRRTSNGLSPFAPDRGHLHHRLLDIGHSHRRSVLIMYAWTFLFAFAVVAMSYEGVPLALFLLTVLLAVGVLVAMALPRLRSRRNGGGAHAAGRHARQAEESERGQDAGPFPAEASFPAGTPFSAGAPSPEGARPVFPQPSPEGARPVFPQPSPQGPAAQVSRPLPMESPLPPVVPPFSPGPPHPGTSAAGDDTAVLSVLPDLSFSTPRTSFPPTETPR
ncbi:MraY family glycosyltransferase [Planobispora longispora]|uniref:Undecaprenyl-phosphate alpha-N-acetylglucosaminyl 1-phosphate transferase n=1 Tax=Planobispora longispora TaxID=28887 RepID=A0A8J3W2W1_9ACTN|nr:MraY family glycosyltransferase [Planobispora longispora]GIH74764.1 undecaprenyl-phosphate alpha-N-acetylglucosaminyl 1-phosphate transferase [Planobispora longispora]